MAGTDSDPPAAQAGPYRLRRRLGAGGMGVVYLAYEESSGTAAAVKLIRPEHVATPEFRQRLRHEVEAAQRVPRFCTAPVLAADLDADPPWVATEYIDAPSLDVVLLERGRLGGAELEAFAVGVAVALRAIHEHGVIHRDLKPSNILLSPVGPRVIDFGIARIDGASTQLTQAGMLVGTPGYMAPEQLRGEAVTTAVDVFAWGSLVTAAATGVPPFGAGVGSVHAIVHEPPQLGDLAEPLRSLVTAALDKDPAARPTAAKLVDRLSRSGSAATTRVIAGAATPVPARPPDPTLLATRPLPTRHRRRWLVAATAAVAAAAVLAGLAWINFRDTEAPTGAAGETEPPPTGQPTDSPATRQPTTMQRLADAGTIRIGVANDLPGFSSPNPDGEPEGFDVEIARLIAGELGIPGDEIRWWAYPRSGMMEAVRRNEVDIAVTPVSITGPNKGMVGLAGPYYIGSRHLLVPAGDGTVTRPESFGDADRKVCAVDDSGSAGAITSYLSDGSRQLVQKDNLDGCVDAMDDGQVDAVVSTSINLIGVVVRDPDTYQLASGGRFGEFRYGIAVRHGDDPFRNWVNDLLEEIISDGRYQQAWDDTVGQTAPQPLALPTIDRY